jgi:hypothetical protein
MVVKSKKSLYLLCWESNPSHREGGSKVQLPPTTKCQSQGEKKYFSFSATFNYKMNDSAMQQQTFKPTA